jgi:hypothetical protein
VKEVPGNTRAKLYFAVIAGKIVGIVRKPAA